MNLLSSGLTHGSAMQCTWTMDNIFMPASSPWIIPKQLSHFNRIPLWVLDHDFSAFLYLVPLCLLGFKKKVYNYRLIPLSCDGNLIFLPFESSCEKMWKQATMVSTIRWWFLTDINGFRGLLKLIMWLKQSSLGSHTVESLTENKGIERRAQSRTVNTLKFTL